MYIIGTNLSDVEKKYQSPAKSIVKLMSDIVSTENWLFSERTRNDKSADMECFVVEHFVWSFLFAIAETRASPRDYSRGSAGSFVSTGS
jgi:hypothetical protein